MTAVQYQEVTDQTARLAELEAVIAGGLQTFVDVGLALLEIRDSRLYRESHGTFDDYCRERWHISKTHANRQIEAAEVAGLLTPIGVIPTNEAQARELVPLLREVPEEVAAVWRDLKAKHGDRLTADLVHRAVDRRLRQAQVIGHMMSSESNEWYTPAAYVEAAREVMGGIDLDAASHPLANEIVKADRYYTLEDDALAQPWSGRVWLNPPYSAAAAFVARCLAEHAAGTVPAAIILVNAHATDTAWFQPLFDYPLCFTNHRIDFYTSEDPTAQEARSTHGSVFAYLGPLRQRFASTFAQFGAVVQRVGA